MNIAIFGAGYVGLVSAACFAHLGNHVICVDVDEERIRKLNAGENPLYEQGLSELILEQLNTGRLKFSDDIIQASPDTDLYIVATGTPCHESGQADLSQVYSVVDAIAQHAHTNAVVVIKSTVPVGSCRKIQAVLNNALKHYGNAIQLGVLANPEFLREGQAVHDFLHPDRIVIGGNAEFTKPLEQLYQPLVARSVPLICMSLESAELTKYAANAMLACRISYINQISQIAERAGAMIDDVSLALGLDHRIGPHFLQAGIGYGGSCFPKDMQALIHTANSLGVNPMLLKSIESINHSQKQWVIDKLKHHFKEDLADKTIGIWGLAFKPGTNDLRDACSLEIIRKLLSSGVRLHIYDPVAIPEAERYFADETAITWCKSAEEVVHKSIDALVITTEWEAFRTFNLVQLRQHMRQAPIIDGRNCFDQDVMRDSGLVYYSVGRSTGLSVAEVIHAY